MSTLHTAAAARIAAPPGSGARAAPALAKCLGLGAAPTFALMALWNASLGARPEMTCAAMRGPSVVGAMALMYLLMSIFHLSPWLKMLRGASQLRGNTRLGTGLPGRPSSSEGALGA